MKNQQFLDKLRNIAEEAEAEKEQLKKTGNLFNIFSALNIQRKENFHSSFIASLLDPYGEHGMGKLFLESFIKQYDDTVDLDISSATVETEYHISKITKDKKRGGRIDILIRDAKKHAIIIENKIDAEDQPAQLIRYDNFAKDNNLQCDIIYLSLDLHEASPESVGKKNDVDYYRYSYKDDIIPWLENCLPQIPNNSLLKNTILQYINTIKKISGTMSSNSLEELKEMAMKPEYEKAVLTLLANQSIFFEQIRHRFIERTQSKAKYLGFKVEVEDGFGKKKDMSIVFSKPRITNKWGILIYSKKGNWKDFVYEFTLIEEEKSKLRKSDLESFPHLFSEFEQSKDLPIGWCYFYSKTGKRGSGRWHNWDGLEAITAMENGEMEKFIVEQVLKPVLDNKIFNKVKDY